MRFVKKNFVHLLPRKSQIYVEEKKKIWYNVYADGMEWELHAYRFIPCQDADGASASA